MEGARGGERESRGASTVERRCAAAASLAQDGTDRGSAQDEGELEVVRVIFGKKGGAAFTSKNGDPQIMVIFADADKNEAGEMFTLSDRAGWKLAQVLRAAGANLLHLLKPIRFRLRLHPGSSRRMR